MPILEILLDEKKMNNVKNKLLDCLRFVAI